MNRVATSSLGTSRTSHNVGELVLRYLADEQAYHVDLLQLLRQLGAGRFTAEHQEMIDDLRGRRERLSSERTALLNRVPVDEATFSTLIECCEASQRPQLHAQVRSVRSFIIQTRLSAERLGRRLVMLQDCLEEIMTGKPPVKSASYDRAGRLKSSPSNRSLLTRRA